MITLIVPTRNRAKTLERVASSFFAQELVNEIIFVEDCGDDQSRELLTSLSQNFPQTRFIYHRNEQRVGASQARNIGVGLASNDYILFCDDDEYMEPGYARICLEKLKHYNAGAVSGRRVYMNVGETPEDAVARFGHGLRHSPTHYLAICEYVNGAIFEGDAKVPFTNAIILTRKDLLQKYGFDPHYAKGNGYREETDYQLNIFVNGHDIYITNDCHTMHLPLSEVKTGGQRVKPFVRIKWSFLNTAYLFDKYYAPYAAKVGLKLPKFLSLALFGVFVSYKELVRPSLYFVYKRISSICKKYCRSRISTEGNLAL